MTAEIVIINQQGVAFAADSALTIGKNRVWKHANKIFSAGVNNDIGIMIYNSGDFLSIPWDVIIKQYKIKISKNEFSKTSELVDDFVEFIKDKKFGSSKFEGLSFGLIFSDIIGNIKKSIHYENKTELYKELLSEIKDQLEELRDVDQIDGQFPFEEFQKNFGKLIGDLATSDFKYKIHKYVKGRLVLLAYEHITRQSSSEYSTGIVFGGFGKDEFFPSVQNIYVDGRSMGVTRVWKSRPSIDLNDSRSQNAAILPFAQVDMAKLFMEGISSKYEQYMAFTLDAALTAKVEEMISNHMPDEGSGAVERYLQEKQITDMVTSFRKEFAEYRSAEFTKPIMDTIRALPREEMAYMARAMVEITALRRRFASSIESVGGDIDVAVISKSDGFIWIHRKHYFDIDKNPDFLHRKASV